MIWCLYFALKITSLWKLSFVLCRELQPFTFLQNQYKIQVLYNLFSVKVQARKIHLQALRYCSAGFIWFENFRPKWGTCTLIGYQKWLVEKWDMGNIYNWAVLGLILFPLKWKRKQLQFAYTKKYCVWKLWHDTREVQRELSAFSASLTLFFYVRTVTELRTYSVIWDSLTLKRLNSRILSWSTRAEIS